MRTAAFRDAPRAGGRYPVVLFSHAEPQDAGVIAEYVASYGYVVANVPSKGAYAVPYRMNFANIESLMRDLSFLIGRVSARPDADISRTGVIGMSNGSLAAVGLASRDPRVRAVVSLDGSIGEARTGALLAQTPGFDIARIRQPILHFYSPDNSFLDLRHVESYVHSDRTVIRTPGMRHSDFLSYGIIDRALPGLLGQVPASPAPVMEFLTEYARTFFDAVLKNDDAQRRRLAEPPSAFGVPANRVEIARLPAVP
jgi:pimeloyl-ACP methyl ester carboxylesterase